MEMVKSFFEEMNTDMLPFNVGGSTPFVYLPGYGDNNTASVFPSPAIGQEDLEALAYPLQEYATIVYLPPYAGIFDPLLPMPNFDKRSEEQSEAFLEPFGEFLNRYPAIRPLVSLATVWLPKFQCMRSLAVRVRHYLFSFSRRQTPSWFYRMADKDSTMTRWKIA